ncbi:hypothetical protein BGZ70_010484 [Mortierella alpina]|uniref:Uncharacterized protein n=1 Tax=Mortierella alpina TaxID=64518 RepID=A0A9P6IZ76_MORAP|nr:hypothetical protein BGZ70_010484 [Mortierella alpina]
MTNDEPPYQEFHCPENGLSNSIQAQIDPVSQEHVVLWKNIQLCFENVRYVRHGKKNISLLVDPATLRDLDPPRIKYCPGVMLEVVLSHAPSSSHGSITSSEPSSSSNRSVLGKRLLRQHSAALLEETDIVKCLARLSMDMEPENQAAVERYSGLMESYTGAIMAGQNGLLSDIKTHMSSTISSLQQELEKKHQELLENDREAKASRAMILAMQRRMQEMQEEALNRLAAIQNRVKALLVQTYELFEFPIPRLFIVLPVEPDLWDKLNPFTHKFRLYFLCECGEHTKASSSSRSHHIHLAKHAGYDILRPTEFFDMYGPYLLTMLEMVKFGIATAGVIVPSLAQLNVLDGIKEIEQNLRFTRETFGSLLDDSITYVGDRVGALDPSADSSNEREMAYREALEGADLRQLAAFLHKEDEGNALGNLYRMTTDEGHVKWVCLDHYREEYMGSAKARFAEIVAQNMGEYDEHSGKVKIRLSTPLTASQFYDGLAMAKGVTELDVRFGWPWEPTKAHIQAFCDAVMKTNISVLRVDHCYSSTLPKDALNRRTRFNPIMELALVELTLGCSDLKKTLQLLQEPLLKLQKLSTLTLYPQPKAFAVFKIKEGKVIPIEVACLWLKNTMEVLSLGTVERLHLPIEDARTGFEEILRNHDSVSEIFLHLDRYVSRGSVLCPVSRGSVLWNHVQRLSVLAHDLERPLLLTTDNGTQIGIRPAEGSELKRDSFVAGDTVIQIRRWTARELDVDADDSSVTLLGKMAHRLSGSIQSLRLNMSMLTNEGVNTLQQALQDIRPHGIILHSSRADEDGASRALFSGLQPDVWSRLSRLHLRSDFLDKWIQYLSPCVSRMSMPQLEQLDLYVVARQLSVSGTSAAWIVGMVSPPEVGTSLQKIGLGSLGLDPDDWALVVDAIDFSALHSLSVMWCSLSEANIMRLKDRVEKEATLDDFHLERLE